MWPSADTTKRSYPPIYKPTYCSTALLNPNPVIKHLKLKIGLPATRALSNVQTHLGFPTLFSRDLGIRTEWTRGRAVAE